MNILEPFRAAASKNNFSREEDLIKFLHERYYAACEFQSDKAEELQWYDSERGYRGRHYTSGDLATTWALVTINHIHRIVETIVPVMGDGNPSSEALPREPSDNDFADIGQALLSFYEDELYLRNKRAEAARGAMIFGSWMWCAEWDDLAMGGTGDAKVRLVDIRNWFGDPFTDGSDIDDMSFQMEEIYLSPYQLEVYFGIRDNYPYYDPSRASYNKLPMEATASSGGSFIHGRRNALPWGGGRRRRWANRPCVFRCLYRTAQHPEGLECFLYKGKLIRKPQPNKDSEGYMPYVMQVAKKLPGEMYGMGVVQVLLSLQHELNRRANQLIDWADLYCNPGLKIPATSGKTDEDFQPFPGWTIPFETKEQADGIGYLAPPGAEPIMMEILQFVVQQMDVISGIREAQSGGRPNAIVSGRAIQELLEAGNTLIREYIRQGEEADVRVSERLLRAALDHTNNRRMLRVLSSDQQQKFIELVPHAKLNGKHVEKFYHATSIDGVDGEGPYGKEYFSQPDPRLDVRLKPGSRIPVSRRQMMQLRGEQLSMGVIDPEEYLKSDPTLNWREVLQRVQKQKASQQQGPQEIHRINTNRNEDVFKVLAAANPAYVNAAAEMILQKMQQEAA